MSGAIPPLPNTPSWRGAQLKHRDLFTFYLLMKSAQNVIIRGSRLNFKGCRIQVRHGDSMNNVKT
jgi:hypothetical protein